MQSNVYQYFKNMSAGERSQLVTRLAWSDYLINSSNSHKLLKNKIRCHLSKLLDKNLASNERRKSSRLFSGARKFTDAVTTSSIPHAQEVPYCLGIMRDFWCWLMWGQVNGSGTISVGQEREFVSWVGNEPYCTWILAGGPVF